MSPVLLTGTEAVDEYCRSLPGRARWLVGGLNEANPQPFPFPTFLPFRWVHQRCHQSILQSVSVQLGWVWLPARNSAIFNSPDFVGILQESEIVGHQQHCAASVPAEVSQQFHDILP